MPEPPTPAPEPEQETRDSGSDPFSAGFYFRPDEPEFSAERSSHGRGGGRRRHRKGFNTAAESDPGNIATMLKNNQEIIVQVMKEPMALKSARITSHISIPGRMLVYLPTVNHIGVSRKIRTDQERKRLRTILHNHRKDRTGGFIVRTASEGCAEADLVQDMEYAFKTWQDIQKRSAEEKAPCVLLEELDLVERMLRDKLDDSFQNIWVDDEAEFATIVSFVDRFMPKLLPRVKLYNKDVDIFDFFNLAPEVQKATRQKVWLKSGGFIVINHTEALIAVDVNTGKYVGKGSNFEETITKVNSDAAKEVARQIRLRNLGGIIVIDFIDMQDKKGKRQVMDLFQQELRRDKSPSKILTFNEFGLVILTRKRTASALEKNLSETCVACGGSGFTRSASTVCYEIYSTVSRMRPSLSGRTLTVRAHPEVIRTLKGEVREVADAIQDHFGLVVALVPDPMLPVQTFDILSE
jgi:ribonuclease G